MNRNNVSNKNNKSSDIFKYNSTKKVKIHIRTHKSIYETDFLLISITLQDLTWFSNWTLTKIN